MEKNKRGISPIIATVLVIMMTAAAFAIIAGVIVPFVKNSLYKGTECIPYKGFYTFDESFGYNCYQFFGEKIKYAFSIKTSTKSELVNNSDEFRIAFKTKGGESKPVAIKNGAIPSTGDGGVWMMDYILPESPADVYGSWYGADSNTVDSCNGDKINIYTCPTDAAKNCQDVKRTTYYMPTRYVYQQRVITCNYIPPALKVPGAGGVISYIYYGSEGESYESAEVYPVLKSGRICGDEKETITLKLCESGMLIEE